MYSFMMCIAKSSNTILQSILNSDALYTSQMYQHWRSVLYIYHFDSNIYYYFGKCEQYILQQNALNRSRFTTGEQA